MMKLSAPYLTEQLHLGYCTRCLRHGLLAVSGKMCPTCQREYFWRTVVRQAVVVAVFSAAAGAAAMLWLR